MFFTSKYEAMKLYATAGDAKTYDNGHILSFLVIMALYFNFPFDIQHSDTRFKGISFYKCVVDVLCTFTKDKWQ